jgi:hypothetical protein
LIQIFGATGAVAGEEAKGEVLIDELTLAPASTTPDTFLTTTQPLASVFNSRPRLE